MASEEFQVWKVGREFVMGGDIQIQSGKFIVDPFYECMDCPMFVDFTQPEAVSEDDLQAWFEVYVDREVGKPRSYPLFRDPAMDIALCELEVDRLLKGASSQGLRPFNANPPPSMGRPVLSASPSPPRQRSPSGSPNSVLCLNPPERPKTSSVVSKSFAWSRSCKISDPMWPAERRPSTAAVRGGAAAPPRGGRREWGQVTSLSKSADLESPKAKCAPELARTSVPNLAPCKRYMLPTATSMRRQSPKPSRPQKPSADGTEGEPPVRRPKWQLPSPKVRRTTPRHSTVSQPRANSKPGSRPEQSVAVPDPSNPSGESPALQHVALEPVKGQTPAVEKSPGLQMQMQVPGPMLSRYRTRNAQELMKVAEARKARLREELNRRGGVEAAWPRQLASHDGVHARIGSRFNEHQQAPWVLAL